MIGTVGFIYFVTISLLFSIPHSLGCVSGFSMAEADKLRCESKSRGRGATPYSLTCTLENLKDVEQELL